jgi:hypothetical protein
MLKQPDVEGKAFEKNVYFSIIEGNASSQTTDKPNVRQTRGRTAKLKLEFSRIGSQSQC